MDRDRNIWTTSSVGTRGPVGTPAFVTRSLPMRRLLERLPQVGAARLILIEGEAGSGKHLLAKHIHALRPAEGNLSLEEASALFNDEPSQRTAQADPISNASERAARGLLLLRGIDELGRTAQAYLLRFIRAFQTGAKDGELSSASFPYQVVCTAHQSLRARVLAGSFLPELYYRLSAVCLSLPPLRERKEDLPGLVQAFIEDFAKESRKPLQGLGSGSLTLLLRHRWPGNVRELESVIRAACFAAEGQWIRPIDLVILPLETSQPLNSDPALPQDLTLDGVIRRHVQRVLRACSGNKARAAARLGISRSTLYRMLESHENNVMPDLSPLTDSTENDSTETEKDMPSPPELLTSRITA